MSNDHTHAREDWEGEVFDNLEAMCAEHPGASAAKSNAPDVSQGASVASQAELANGLRNMPSFDEDDGWCPRLA